jgi:hypothetical protein
MICWTVVLERARVRPRPTLLAQAFPETARSNTGPAASVASAGRRTPTSAFSLRSPPFGNFREMRAVPRLSVAAVILVAEGHAALVENTGGGSYVSTAFGAGPRNAFRLVTSAGGRNVHAQRACAVGFSFYRRFWPGEGRLGGIVTETGLGERVSGRVSVWLRSATAVIASRPR